MEQFIESELRKSCYLNHEEEVSDNKTESKNEKPENMNIKKTTRNKSVNSKKTDAYTFLETDNLFKIK